MKVIAILNRKGGVGKSTLSTNLARSLQLRGSRVLLVDTDSQRSALDWSETAEGVDVPQVVGVDRPSIHKELPRLASKYDYAVIDGAAKVERMSISAIQAADLVLIPVQPSALDVWTASELAETVREQQARTGSPRAAYVVSRAIPGTRLARSAQGALESLSFPVLEAGTCQRVAYPEAIGRGLSVLDLADEKAKAEISAITDESLALISEKAYA